MKIFAANGHTFLIDGSRVYILRPIGGRDVFVEIEKTELPPGATAQLGTGDFDPK